MSRFCPKAQAENDNQHQPGRVDDEDFWQEAADDNDAADGEAQDDDEQAGIKTKKDLFKFYEGKGPAAMTLHMLSDTLLQG